GPQDQRYIAEPGHPIVHAIHRGLSAVSPGIVECQALLEVGPGGWQLSQPVQGVPEHMVGFHQERGLLTVCRQGEELLCEVLGGMEFCSGVMKDPQSVQDAEELARCIELPAELLCPRIGSAQLRGRPPFGRHQWSTEAEVQTEFLLQTL